MTAALLEAPAAQALPRPPRRLPCPHCDRRSMRIADLDRHLRFECEALGRGK